MGNLMTMDSSFQQHIDEANLIKSSGRWDALNQKILQLANHCNKDDAWLLKVFESLTFQNFSEYFNIKRAYEAVDIHPSLLAWRARNLLEICVWAVYCSKARQNARLFYEDAGRDVLNVYESFMKWGVKTSQESDWLNTIQDGKQAIYDKAELEGIEPIDGPYQRVQKVAEECGFGHFFQVNNKFLSKFAHPTAMLILANSNPIKEKQLTGIFYSFGCMFFVGAFVHLEGISNILLEPE